MRSLPPLRVGRPPNFPGEQGPGIDHTLPPVNSTPWPGPGTGWRPPGVEDPWDAILNPDGGSSGTTGSSDPTGDSGSGEVEAINISDLPFRFNPPMHKLSRLVLTDLAEGNKHPENALAEWYDETNNTYKSNSATRPDNGSATTFEGLRLGRIIMDDMAVSRGVRESGKRYGFRFLYNPTELSGGMTINTSFIPDQRNTATFVLQTGLEQMTFEVLLNRIPDVVSKTKVSDYIPQISDNDLKRLKEQGTQYDLDFLYRCANGIHNTRQRSRTGDIGVLLPNPCRLILGPYTTRGAVVSVVVNDQMFSGNMVPILTYATITFSRYLSMADPDDWTRLESEGISREDGSSSAARPGPTTGPGSGFGMSLTGRSVYQYAIQAGFTQREADTMTQIANLESSWKTRAHNSVPPDDSYGLWQINMYGNLGPSRRKQWGLKNNEDLYDPTVNAKAAYSIYKSQGYRAWSVYQNGSYKTVPISWR